jgi:Icc-related predicted phosphoesterase
MSLKIVHISDTHLRDFPEMEPADLLVHSGDGLNYGSFEELPKFVNQFKSIHQNYKKIILVPGNHDWVFQHNPVLAIQTLKEKIPNIEILIHDVFVFEGVKIFGTSWQPNFFNWAFNLSPHELVEKYKQIPDDTEILITHVPPKGILDFVINDWNPNGKNVGSPELQDEIPRLTKLRAHMFGHIHSARGTKQVGNIWYSNASICDERYKPNNKENVVEL